MLRTLRRTRRRRTWATLTAAIIAAGLWLHPTLPDSIYPTTDPTVSAAASQTIHQMLTQVIVVDDIPDAPGYDRSCKKGHACVFGPAWNDPLDSTGCDTRSRLLRASLKNVQYKPGTRNCKPIAGTLDPDPYTGRTVDLADVEADHIYALSRAWDAGAWQWSQHQRQVFANDLTELIAVSSTANRAKSDYGLEWLPTHQPCEHIARYLTVATKYELPITTKEHTIATTTCPAETEHPHD